MTDFIAMIYEWFGYRNDLGTHLRGWDINCDDFTGTNLYFQVFLTMILINAGLFVIMYLVIDRITSTFNKKSSWWIIALIGSLINFGIAYSLPGTVDPCTDLEFGQPDFLMFGLANGVWSLVFFALLTSFPFPRNLSTNAHLTTFWKP
jgi:hypothetical protein